MMDFMMALLSIGLNLDLLSKEAIQMGTAQEAQDTNLQMNRLPENMTKELLQWQTQDQIQMEANFLSCLLTLQAYLQATLFLAKS